MESISDVIKKSEERLIFNYSIIAITVLLLVFGLYFAFNLESCFDSDSCFVSAEKARYFPSIANVFQISFTLLGIVYCMQIIGIIKNLRLCKDFKNYYDEKDNKIFGFKNDLKLNQSALWVLIGLLIFFVYMLITTTSAYLNYPLQKINEEKAYRFFGLAKSAFTVFVFLGILFNARFIYIIKRMKNLCSGVPGTRT